MKIGDLKAYSNDAAFIKDDFASDRGGGKIAKEKLAVRAAAEETRYITEAEKEFFIKLFPESAEIIKRHTLFNRNGRIHSPNLDVGRIIDGKA